MSQDYERFKKLPKEQLFQAFVDQAKIKRDLEDDKKKLQDRISDMEGDVYEKQETAQKAISELQTQVETLMSRKMDPALQEVIEQMNKRSEANIAHMLKQQDAMVKNLTKGIKASTGGGGGATGTIAKLPSCPTPEKMPENITPAELESWVSSYDNYLQLSKVKDEEEEDKRARLWTFLSKEMQDMAEHALDIKIQDTKMTSAEILQSIKDHVNQKISLPLQRAKFEQRNQRQGEDFDMFYVSLKKLAVSANICKTCFEERIASRITVGIRDTELQKKLMALPNEKMNLADVVKLCQTEESAKKNAAAAATSQEQPVNKTQWKKGNRGQPEKGNSSKPTQSDGKSRLNRKGQKPSGCWGCGSFKFHKKEECSAKDSKCKHCGMTGHFSNVCLNRERKEHKEFSSKKNRMNQLKIQLTNRINDIENSVSECPQIKVSIEDPKTGRHIANRMALPDSGSGANAMGIEDFTKMGFSSRDLMDDPEDDDVKLITADKTVMAHVGHIILDITFGSLKSRVKFYICPKHDGLILNWKVMIDLGLLKPNYQYPCGRVHLNKVQKLGEMEDLPEKPSAMDLEKYRNLLISSFSDVFSSEKKLRTMVGEPMKIHLKKDVKPSAITRSRKIPFAYRDKVKATLKEMVSQGIIVPVEDMATEWCHPIVPIAKRTDEIRVCVDLTNLNKNADRAVYPMTSPREAVDNITPDARFFSKFDAKSGYWQMELDKNSQDLTTFLTPWGRYKFLRAPMGFVGTGDEYCRRGDIALAGLENTEKVVDDILCHDKSFKEHFKRVVKLLEKCQESGITLNPKKFVFAAESVDYVGYVVGRDGVKADPAKIAAIKDFPTPTNLTELRSFLGLSNQLTDFTTDLSQAAGPLRSLLKKKNEFNWVADHDKAFQNVKKILMSPKVLDHFDPTAEHVLQTDASRRKGLGFALLQKREGQEGWKLVHCGSRFITETESRYAMIELELTAAVWAMKKCRTYLLGKAFELVTDHRPLLPILNDYTLDTIENPRLQRLKEKTSQFQFTTTWKKGRDHMIPDALSRAPVLDPTKEDEEAEHEVEIHIKTVVNAKSLQEEGHPKPGLVDPILQKLRDVGRNCPEYKMLHKTVQSGFPRDRKQVTTSISQYWPLRDKLYTEEDLILFDGRIIVPKEARREALKRLHDPHLGIEKTKKLLIFGK